MKRRTCVVLGVVLALLAWFLGPWWTGGEARGHPELGISFSCRQATYLGDDCDTEFVALLQQLKPSHVRLSLYWSEVEAVRGQFDFSEADMLVTIASRYGADVLLTAGIKSPRFPEVFVPVWALDGGRLPDDSVIDRLPGVRAAALEYLATAVSHFAASATIAGWQIENEPFIKNFDEGHGWTVSNEMVAAEAATVRAADPGLRPVVVTHSAWTIYDQAWKHALASGDVLGENVFTKKSWLAAWSYFFPYEIGPFVPNLSGQSAAAKRAGKQLWITELQAEPEEQRSLANLDGATIGSISPRLLRHNLELASLTGATRVYLWGAEWWYHEHTHAHNDGLWQTAAVVLASR